MSLSLSSINFKSILPKPVSSTEATQQSQVNSIIEKSSNLGSGDPFRGPTARSLFYEAGKRKNGKYGQFLLYSLGNSGNQEKFFDQYYRSESSENNRTISSIRSKNPSAIWLVKETADLEAVYDGNSQRVGTLSGKLEKNILGGLSAPYYWKDFLYCKYYGTIPNNYMITLRRFPTPMLDNMSLPEKYSSNPSEILENGLGRPVAQAVTWFGGNTGNKLNDLISFTTGINWSVMSQKDIIDSNSFSKGLFADLPSAVQDGADSLFPELEKMKTLLNAAGYVANPQVLEEIKKYRLRDRAKNGSGMGLLSEYIWTSVDVVTNTYVRDTGLKFEWNPIKVVFDYDLTSVGEVNSKAAMLDIMANLLSIGTNYGNFLTPQIRYNNGFPAIGFPGGDEGLELFYSDPLAWYTKYSSEVLNTISNTSKKPETVGSENQTEIDKAVNEFGKITDPAKRSQFLSKLSPEVKSAVSTLFKAATLNDYTARLQAPASLLSGAPVGEWHLVIGNPCNPIAMMGNLICKDVKIEWSESLGPDDFPNSLRATFTLDHGRDRERGEIESIYNRGEGRLYQSSISTSANGQSYSSHIDVNGNVLSKETPDRIYNGGGRGTLDQLIPKNK